MIPGCFFSETSLLQYLGRCARTMSYTQAPTEKKRKFVCDLKPFSFICTLLIFLAAIGVALGVPIAEASFTCYFLNRDIDIPATEQGSFACISPEWQVDRTASKESDRATDSNEVKQAEGQWFDQPSPVWSMDDGKGSFLQQPGSLLSALWQWLMSLENVFEKREKNSTGFALPEWPTSTPESALRLSGGGFPPDPPPPPLFIPGISGRGLFKMPDWQFDYLSVLLGISQRLKQWLYNGYPTTSGQSRPFVSDKDLSAALAGITQKMAFNRSLFSRVPLDASELLAELSGKDLSGHGQMHQPETVMLYPVFMLPQSDSNDFEEAQGVEYVGETCSVCLLNLEQSDDVMKTSCLHLFHLECLKRWLTGEVNMEGNRFCPYCRHDQSALGDFLTWKEIRKGLQEVIHIVMGMLLGRGTWPEDDYSIFVRLNAALFCNNSAIAEQARAIYPLVKLYSAQRLVLQVRAGNRTWPGCEGFIHLGSLRMLVDNPDPAIAKQARAIYPLANLYAVQHQVSQVQAEDEAWNDSYIHTWLGIARDCNDLVIAEQAEALEPLVNYYSVRHLLAQVQAGSETWPDDDRYIYTRLSSAQRSNDRDLAERARAIEPTVHLFSVQHLVLQMQTGTRTCWPEDDNNVYVRLSNAEDSGDPTIAQQARALRPLVDQYKSNSPEN